MLQTPLPLAGRDDARWTGSPLGVGLVWLVVYLGAAELSLFAQVPGTDFALVGPSAGVAALWALCARRHDLPLTFALLSAGALLAALRAHGGEGIVLGRMLAVVLLSLLFRVLVLRWTRLKGPDERLRRMTGLESLVGLGAAAALAGLVQAGVAEGVQLAVGQPDWATLGQRWLRNAIAVFTVATTGLLLWAWRHPRAESDRDDHDPLVPPMWQRVTSVGVTETAFLLVATAMLFFFSFFVEPGLPMSFTLFLPSMWAGLRLPPLFAALHGLLTGISSVVLTLAGWGMYARIEDPGTQALVAQTFLGIVFTSTVVLALARHQSRIAQHRSGSRAQVLDTVLSSSTDGVILVDETDRVLLANPAATRLLGTRAGDVFRPVDHLDLFDDGGQYLESGSEYHRLAFVGADAGGKDLVVRDRDNGDERTLHVTGTHLSTGSETPGRALLTFRDVTAERAQQRTLASFAGVVAHDLKNPLAVVEGWSEMLESELRSAPALDSATGLGMVRRISGAAAQMRTLIGELLTYTLARDQDLRTVPVDLRALAEEVADHYRGDPGGDAAAVVDVHCEHLVCGDPLLLRQLLENLVGNSVKYVAPGVRPHVTIDSSALPADRVEVSVTDNGLGIPAEERERVFDSFYRLDRPGYAGTGLGLAICQRIAERHGGTLRVADGPHGIGSTFSFTLAAEDRCQ